MLSGLRASAGAGLPAVVPFSGGGRPVQRNQAVKVDPSPVAPGVPAWWLTLSAPGERQHENPVAFFLDVTGGE
jgi:hypothetical protein